MLKIDRIVGKADPEAIKKTKRHNRVSTVCIASIFTLENKSILKGKISRITFRYV
jgi:hypothetical protein